MLAFQKTEDANHFIRVSTGKRRDSRGLRSPEAGRSIAQHLAVEEQQSNA